MQSAITYIFSFNPHHNHSRFMLLHPFYRGGQWDIELLSGLCQVTQLVNGRARIRIQVSIPGPFHPRCKLYLHCLCVNVFDMTQGIWSISKSVLTFIRSPGIGTLYLASNVKTQVIRESQEHGKFSIPKTMSSCTALCLHSTSSVKLPALDHQLKLNTAKMDLFSFPHSFVTGLW